MNGNVENVMVLKERIVLRRQCPSAVSVEEGREKRAAQKKKEKDGEKGKR